jgi:hypothetical protein
MRRTTTIRRTTTTIIITGLLAAAVVPVASAQAARPLAKADAERIAVRHMQATVSAAEAYGVYAVKSTSRRCQRVSAGRIACNFALYLRGLTPEATDHLCLSSVAIVRTPGDRIVRETAALTCD